MTARWVVDAVSPHRDLNITWQPISLLEKNQPEPDSDYYEPVYRTHRYLRVMESVRAAEGDDAVFPLYWEFGRRIHHDHDRTFDAADALTAVSLDPAHAAAFDDEAWDDEIRKRMNVGLELAGTDIGTPLIAFDDDNGDKVALFGPVITRVPDTAQSLRLWDGFIAMATIPGFWEVKRTRTERPEFGDRP
ncbi:MAG: disulfide bond formation protein DsbA [Acidimicrobiales bacterium]